MLFFLTFVLSGCSRKYHLVLLHFLSKSVWTRLQELIVVQIVLDTVS